MPFYRFFVLILLVLTACSEEPPQTQAANPAPAPSTFGASQAAHPGSPQSPSCFDEPSHDKVTACLYERHAEEALMCGKVSQLISSKGLLPQLEKDAYAAPGGTEALLKLLNGALRDDVNVAYIQARPDYFTMGQNLHVGVLGGVYFGQTGLYCAPSGRRLKELESLGASDFAWRARENWLDNYLAIVHYPWIEMDGKEEFLFTEFDRLKQLYNRPQDRLALQQWVNKAEKSFLEAAESASHDDGLGLTKEKHLQTLRQWARQLRTGL